MSRTVLVPADSPVLSHSSTTVTHRYANGTVLVETDAPIPETGDSGESPVAGGLRLGDAGEADSRRMPPTAETAARSDGDISAYVEFVAQPDRRWLAALSELGVRVLAYQPENSYLCFGPARVFRELPELVLTSEGVSAIRGVTELTQQLKRRLRVVGEARETVLILVAAASEQRDGVLRELADVPGVEILGGAGNDVLDGGRFRVRARTTGDGQENLLRQPRVLSVEPYHSPVPEDERVGLILAGKHDAAGRPSGSYLGWLREHAVDGRGAVIGIVDGGVDVAHPAFAGRIRDLTGGQADWHATMVAGRAAGNYLAETDADGLIYGLGTAPGAALLSQDKMRPASELCRETVAGTEAGTAIQNNSWGKETRNPMDYGSDEALYDALVRNADPGGVRPVPLTICFSAGNSGPRGLTRPKAAKNVIVTGNSENFRPDVGNLASDDIREVYSSSHGSSHGNCGDGRIRPHVVAPGEWTASANYDCRPGEDEYLSPLLTWGGGSSAASPNTAGAGALLIQWWRRNNDDHPPSPAMLRALIVNGAEPITTGGPIPNNRQGWGRLNVANILDPAVARVTADLPAVLHDPGDDREWRIRVVDPDRPLKITLAWTDPPGAVGSGGSAGYSPMVNRLALRAEVGAAVFRGSHDRFRNGWSVADDVLAAEGTNAQPEGSDCLQNIFLPPRSVPGLIRVTVTALNITTNCLTGTFEAPRQDFALVISNGRVEVGGSPTTVVVAVDHNAGGPPPTGADGHWADGPDSDGRPDGGPLPPDAGETPPVCSGDGAAWWAAGEERPLVAESTAEPATDLIDVPQRVAGGLDLLDAMGRGVEEISPPDGPTQGTTVGHAIAGMRARLARAAAGSVMPGLAAVLVAGTGTRVTTQDVLGLRALAMSGTLFLVSDSAGLLDFLAPRIGPRAGVRYRLAGSPAALPDLVLDTLAEAGGLQTVVVSGPQVERQPAADVWTHRFSVVPTDRGIVVQIRFPLGRPPTEARLSRPGAADVRWAADAVDQVVTGSMSIKASEDCVEFRDSAAAGAAGTWAVRLTAGAGTRPPEVKVWSLGGPPISVAESAVTRAGEAGRDATARLIRISAGPGDTLSQASIPRSLVAAPGAGLRAETGRDHVIRVRPTRLDRQGRPVAEDDRRAIPVPELGQLVTAPAASVVDAPITVAGADADGHGYVRRIRANLVPARDAAAVLLYTCGQITDVRVDGPVTTLLVSHGRHSRTVVADPAALALPGHAALRGRTFVLAVRGDRLVSLFRQLPTAWRR